ncbi:MAG: N-acetylmuramoyl-L-alanine amidase [Ruminococcus sp.]|nr:N-acetylmuramoyl-L-alanine amidase [Ruminococcus sp.]
MAKKIYLSPSNQYSNTYATGNTNEMAQCDKIASATATALKRCGFEVKVGKSGDTMQNRCVESDNFKADIHMPIHTNAYNGKVTGGTRIFCLNSNGKKVCDAVLSELGKISPGTADSVKYHTGLYEINVPVALSVYVECEFHDTKTGSDWIINNITNIGEAICKGLCNYYGVTYKSGTSTQSTTSNSSTTNSSFKSYIVRITASDGVNIRKGAGTNYAVVGAIPKGGAYTIVAESTGTGATKWGKLKSGAGWIALDYTEKIK